MNLWTENLVREKVFRFVVQKERLGDGIKFIYSLFEIMPIKLVPVLVSCYFWNLCPFWWVRVPRRGCMDSCAFELCLNRVKVLSIAVSWLMPLDSFLEKRLFGEWREDTSWPLVSAPHMPNATAESAWLHHTLQLGASDTCNRNLFLSYSWV